MSANEEREIREAFNRMKRVCKVIRIVVLVCLVAFTLGWIIFACLMIAGHIRDGSDTIGLDAIAYFILFGLLIVFLLIITLRIFSDICANESPFSFKQVKRLRFMGSAFLISTAIEALLSLSFSFDMPKVSSFIGLVGNSTSDPSYIHVNVLTLIIALACFGLAIIFKYGILLQQLSDDTL